MTIPLSLPKDLVDQAKQDREDSWLGTLSSDLNQTVTSGWNDLTHVASGIADTVVPQTSPLAEALKGGGLTLPSLDELLDPGGFQAAAKKAAQTASSLLTGGVKVPSLSDLTPGSTTTRTASSTAPAQTGDLRAYTRAKAASLGIDPDVAERVAMSEGGFDDPVRQSDVVYQGKREASYGPFQLNVDGGMGSTAIQRGHDPRDPANVYRNIDFALESARDNGWGAYHGAARIGIGERQGIGAVAPGPPPAVPAPGRPAAMPQASAEQQVTYRDQWNNTYTVPESAFNARPGGNADVTVVSRSAPAVPQPSTARPQGDLYPRQDLLDDPDKWAVCGPLGIMAFAAMKGQPIDYQTAKNAAIKAGWTAASGMAGPASQVAALNSIGVASKLGPIDVGLIAREVRNGNPVGLSSPGASGHYFTVQGVDDQGRLDLGNSALALKASGGRRWFTVDELRQLGPIGNVTAAIYLDNPASPTPSVAAAPIMPRVSLNAGVAANAPAAPVAGSASPPPSDGSPLDEARANSQGGAGLVMKAGGDPVPMPGPQDAQAGGRGVQGIGVPEYDTTGYWDPRLQTPVDVRVPGERPYDATDDEGADRTNDPLIPYPAPAWTRPSVRPEDVAAPMSYRQPLGAQPELPPDAPAYAGPGDDGTAPVPAPVVGPGDGGYTPSGSQPSGGAPTAADAATSSGPAAPALISATASAEVAPTSQPLPDPAPYSPYGEPPDAAHRTDPSAAPQPAGYQRADPQPYGQVTSTPGEADYAPPRGYFEPTSTERRAVEDAGRQIATPDPVSIPTEAPETWPSAIRAVVNPILAELQNPGANAAAGRVLGAVQGAGTVASAITSRVDPLWVPLLTRYGIAELELSPEQLARFHDLNNRSMPGPQGTSTPGLTAAETAELNAIVEDLGRRYERIKNDPDQVTEAFNAAPGSMILPLLTNVLAMGVGSTAKGAAQGLATRAGAGARTARAVGYGADIAAQSAIDPTNLLQPAFDAPVAGVGAAARGVRSAGRAVSEAAQGAGRRIGEGLAANAERTATADARMAAGGSTMAPASLGVVPPGMEPRRPGLSSAARIPERVPPPEGYAAPGELSRVTADALPNRQVYEQAGWQMQDGGFIPPPSGSNAAERAAAKAERMRVWDEIAPNQRIPPGLKNPDMEAFLDDLARMRDGILTGDTKPETSVLGSLIALASVKRSGTAYSKMLDTLSRTTGRPAEELAARTRPDIYFQGPPAPQEKGILMRPEILWAMVAGDTTDPVMMKMLAGIARPESFPNPRARQAAIEQGVQELYRRIGGGATPGAPTIYGAMENIESILGRPRTREGVLQGGGAPWMDTEPSRWQEIVGAVKAMAGQAPEGSPLAGKSGEALRLATIDRLLENSPAGIGPVKTRFTASMTALPDYATLDTRMLRDVFGLSPKTVLSTDEYEKLAHKLWDIGSDSKYLYGQQWLPWEHLTGEKTTYNALTGVYDRINGFFSRAEQMASETGRPIGGVIDMLARQEKRVDIQLANPAHVQARVGLAFRELTGGAPISAGHEALIEGLQPGEATKGQLQKAFPQLFKLADDAGLTIEGKPGVGIGGWKSDETGRYYTDRTFDFSVAGPKPAVRWFAGAMMMGLPKEEAVLLTYRGAGAKLEDHVGSLSVKGMTRAQMEEWSTALSDTFPGWSISAKPRTVQGQRLYDIDIMSGAKTEFGGDAARLEADLNHIAQGMQGSGHVVHFNGIEPAEMEFLERADVEGVVRGGPRGATVVPARDPSTGQSATGPDAGGASGLRSTDGNQAGGGGQAAALGSDPLRGQASPETGAVSPGASPAVSSTGSTATYGMFGVPPERWRKPTEAELREGVGQKYPDIRGPINDGTAAQIGEPSAEMIRDSRMPRDAVHPDLREAGIGPEITPQIDMSGRMNASAGAPSFSNRELLGAAGRTVNSEALNVAGGAVAGNVMGGTDPFSNPDASWQNIAANTAGGVAGALLLRHGGRLSSRLRAPEDGALATFGGLPSLPGVNRAVQGAQQRAAALAARGEAPLSPLQWTRKAFASLGYSSMIGPSTATVNIFGNLHEPVWAGPKEVVRALVRGNPQEAVTMAAGTFRGLGQVGEAMRDAIAARGRYASNPDHPMLSEQTVTPIGHAVATALEFGGRVFSGMPDAIFGTVARSAGEYREAAQIATDMGLKGNKWTSYVDTLLTSADAQRTATSTRYTSAEAQRVLKAGEEYATSQTFRDELGTVGKGASGLAGRNIPVVGNLITPFFNTPWNMGQRLLERSPVGFFMNSQPTRFDKYYDAIVGSALITGIALGPAASGMITGGGPSDPEKRKMLEAEGWKPYHTLVGDTYVPNRVFGIYGKVLNAAGDAHDAMAYQKKDADLNAIGDDAMRRLGNLIKEEPYLQGLSDILGMFGSSGAADAANRYAASTVTRMVPYGATARAIGTAQDPYDREVDRGKGVSPGETFTQRVQQGLGMREGLPVAQNAMGEPKPNPQQGLSAVLPKTNTKNSQPVVRAYLDAGVDIGAPPPDVEGVALTPSQRRRYQAVMGRELERVAGPTVRAETWKTVPPAQKTILLETFHDIARTLAAASVQAEGGAAYWQDYVKSQLEKAGVAP